LEHPRLPDESAYLATIDPITLERKTILNNYYERPFMSFNDLEMDREGNYYLTDSYSGWVSEISPQKEFHNHNDLNLQPKLTLYLHRAATSTPTVPPRSPPSTS
jgi:sugar lactone lactonase YvrE